MPAYPAAAVREYSQMAQEKMLPLQGAVFGGGIYYPGRCPGLSDVALSGRWIARLADASQA